MSHAPFHSRFGGLWIDRADWRQQITGRYLIEEQSGAGPRNRRPNFFSTHLATVRHHGQLAYCSQHYNLKLCPEDKNEDEREEDRGAFLSSLSAFRKAMNKFAS